MSPEKITTTDEFIKGLWRENPVFVQVLGMCPVLAVTNATGWTGCHAGSSGIMAVRRLSLTARAAGTTAMAYALIPSFQ